MTSVSSPQFRKLRVLRHSLGRVLTSRLEHEEAPVIGLSEQALVNERLQVVEVRVADRRGRLQVKAAGEDGKAAKEALLCFAEKLVAPLDRRTKASAGAHAP